MTISFTDCPSLNIYLGPKRQLKEKVQEYDVQAVGDQDNLSLTFPGRSDQKLSFINLNTRVKWH